jgi:hypothetical protein
MKANNIDTWLQIYLTIFSFMYSNLSTYLNNQLSSHSWVKVDESKGVSTLCIFRALAAPRSPTVKSEILDPIYHAQSQRGIGGVWKV